MMTDRTAWGFTLCDEGGFYLPESSPRPNLSGSFCMLPGISNFLLSVQNCQHPRVPVYDKKVRRKQEE